MAVSERVPDGTGDGPAPYFFLSYARHHRSGEEKAEQAPDPDRWTLRFFDDLAYEVTELTTLPGGARPGFMDRDIRVGQQWQRRISEALAACRVFVPLYTPRYFNSLNCASEWYLFQARQSAHELTSGARPEAIIPVLWLPIPDSELPAVARALQFDHHALGEAYARLGFLQLIRLESYKDEYQLAIHALARHVVQIAQEGAPRAARPVDFTSLRGRFETADELFEAAGELVRRAGAGAGGRAPLSLAVPRPAVALRPAVAVRPAVGTPQLALPPGTGELWKPPGPLAENRAENRAEKKAEKKTGPETDQREPAESAAPSTVPEQRSDPVPATVPGVQVDLSPDEHPPVEHSPAELAVAAYLRVVGSKLAEWFTGRPAQVSSGDFDDFYFRSVHPAAKAALLRQLTPHADGPFPRPPRLRGDASDPPPPEGARHGA